MNDSKGEIKVFVDPLKCCAAGVCMAVAPFSFAIGPERLAVGINPFGDDIEAVLRAIDECPMHAISLVTHGPADQQLSERK